ncbi:hypothetical protein [Rummeliibacillus sp. SL167]|uniref:hypothetical protein n=1 Tax=Rummeliibacillus sp. SL167 TaxID=2579792 RepID=UPI0011B5E270|nr:hypothetical protein [Rummeliibacillus sp. SL167]
MENTDYQEYHSKRKSKKGLIISTIIIVTIAFIGGGGYSWYKYQQDQKEKYAKKLAKTSAEIQLEFLLASIVADGSSDVWNDAIDDGRDFNLQLTTYHDILSENGTVKERKNGQKKIRNMMKALQNPPDDYNESYKVLKQIYGIYSKMLDQALYPSGSLLEFNRNINDLYNQFEQKKEELSITLPTDVKKLKKKYDTKNQKELE